MCFFSSNNVVNLVVVVCFLIAHADATFIGEIRNISQCFVEALIIRTKNVATDVSYRLEQITGANRDAAASIEENFKKQVSSFIVEYVFFFMEAEQRFQECESLDNDIRCSYDVAKDLTIRTVPVATARLTEMVGGVNQAVKTMHKNATTSFIDVLENSRSFARDLLSSTTQCVYKH